MSNLKGSDFKKQIINAKVRIEARGQSRQHKKDLHFTHSNALALKRDNWLESFANYASSLERGETKLNKYMDNKTISQFLEYRTKSMSKKSAINFTRGFSALTDALKATGVSIGVDKNVFDTHVKKINAEKQDKSDHEHRDIKNIEEVIEKLHQINPSFAALSTLQSSLGVRVSEGIELLQHPYKYIKQDNTVQGLIGKGNHAYDQKSLSKDLLQILNKRHVINYSSYQKALVSMGLSSHRMRFTYSKHRMEDLLKNHSYLESLHILSRELNHVRPQISEWYLSKTSF